VGEDGVSYAQISAIFRLTTKLSGKGKLARLLRMQKA
jgi:hypothetical protein